MCFTNNTLILMMNMFVFCQFCMGPFKWPKTPKLFIIVLLIHFFISQRACRALIKWLKATSPPQEWKEGRVQSQTSSHFKLILVWGEFFMFNKFIFFIYEEGCLRFHLSVGVWRRENRAQHFINIWACFPTPAPFQLCQEFCIYLNSSFSPSFLYEN